MKLVVVGSKGTLGARLTAELGAEGVDFRVGDGSAREPWRETVGAADVVVNVGGPRVRPGLRRADYLREHVGVAERVVDAMKRGGHLIHVSSTAIFGARGTHLAASSDPAPERFPMPDYAAAKLAAEMCVRAAAPARLALTVLRPSMVYGTDVESALESLRGLRRRGVGLRLRPARLRQHLLHVDLLVATVRAALDKPQGTRPLLVADPFVLENADLDLPARLPVVVPVGALAKVQRPVRWLRVSPLALDSLAVLALDNVFRVDETFERLDLSSEGFARRASFNRYWLS